MDADHQEDIEKLNAGFQEWESDYTDQERSMGFELLDPKDLTFTKFLGEGTSASVYVGELKGRGTVAIKVLRERIEEKLWQDFKKELKVMSLVRGPRIVEFYGVCMRPRFCIALEFCELGSLLHVLERQDIYWEWDKTFDLIRQVIQAVNDLHTWNPQIVHRDLKSLNLLIDKDFNVKVCDFGLARQTEVTEDADGQINTLSTLNKLRGTYGYSAPELYEKQKATNKSDVFSLGIILWEIVSRVITGVYARPYAEYTNMRYDFQVLIGVSKKGIRPTLPATCPEEFKMMITSCWSGQAEKRPDCGFLLIQLNMIKGREYNKNKQQWDALLPPRPPGAITPGISSASSTAVPTVPEKNGHSGPESAASTSAKSAPATTSSTSTSTSSPPAKASSPAPAPAPAQVTAPAVATTRTSADKDGKEEKKEKKKKSSKKKEKKASSTTTEEGEKKKKKSSKKKEKTDKDTAGEKEKKKKKKKTTTKSDE